jgi:hypothetical protein
MSGSVPCTACGQLLTFKALFPAKQVCPSCRTLVYRGISGVSGAKAVPPVPEDMTPLQTGTRGQYQGQAFELIGQIRYASENGYQNWWAMLMPDGTCAWLTEAHGDYAVLTKSPLKIAPHKLTGSSPGKEIQFETGFTFIINGLDKKTGLHLEGELPANSGEHAGFISVELGNLKHQLAVVNVYALDRIIVYTGRYVPFHTFQFEQLRDLHEWI